MVVLIDDSVFKDIAQAIREKNGTEETYAPEEMAEAISAITTGETGGETGGTPEDDGTIKFYIDDVQYTSTANTNFNLWCNSEYNVGNRFYTYLDEDGSKRVADSGQAGNPDLYRNGTKIYGNGLIVAGAHYTTGA
jgi:hypothetical protein